MKKSEMRKLLVNEIEQEEWTGRTADAILRKMETMGQVWDPEEESPPKRLCRSPGGTGIIHVDLGPHTRRLTYDEEGEVIRRYNLWPEIERRARVIFNCGPDMAHAQHAHDLLRLMKRPE